jgi:5-methylthioadenosine/S-adenosylhomocysteine deaminase
MGALRIVVVRGGRVLDNRRGTAETADMLIQGDTILEIGPPGVPAPADATEIDANGKLLIPGLINSHTHGHGSFAKGTGDRGSLELLLNGGPAHTANRHHQDNYLATLLSAAEMVRKGCTAAYDLTFEFPGPSREGLEAVGRAYADIGMRAVIAPMMADRTFYQAIPGLLDAIPERLRGAVEKVALAPYETMLRDCAEVLRTWPFDHGQIRPALAPTIPLHCADEFISGCGALAREHGVGLHMHLAESKIQALSGIQRYGKTLTAHLDDLGFLGPDFTAAHAIWLDHDDIGRLADNGASVAHNPGSNMRLGSGLSPIRAMIERGINVGLGTDGCNSSDNQNMFEAMRLATFTSRIQTHDMAEWLSSAETVGMATEGAARALGFGDAIGRLAPGCKADVVFLDLANINFVPLNDPITQMVLCEDGSAVHSVMIDGRMVLEAGRFTTIDYGRLVSDVEAAVERLGGLNADLKGLLVEMENVVGTFCIGLAKQPYHVHRLGGFGEHGECS